MCHPERVAFLKPVLMMDRLHSKYKWANGRKDEPFKNDKMNYIW